MSDLSTQYLAANLGEISELVYDLAKARTPGETLRNTFERMTRLTIQERADIATRAREAAGRSYAEAHAKERENTAVLDLKWRSEVSQGLRDVCHRIDGLSRVVAILRDEARPIARRKQARKKPARTRKS